MARRRPRDPKAVGECVADRRTELHLTQQQAADAAGISKATWRLVECGYRSSYSALTLTGIARTLRWPQDAIERLRAGEDPVVLTREAEAAEMEMSGGAPFSPWLARRWSMLATHEQQRVEALIDEILASRRARHF